MSILAIFLLLGIFSWFPSCETQESSSVIWTYCILDIMNTNFRESGMSLPKRMEFDRQTKLCFLSRWGRGFTFSCGCFPALCADKAWIAPFVLSEHVAALTLSGLCKMLKFMFIFWFETRSHYIPLAVFELTIDQASLDFVAIVCLSLQLQRLQACNMPQLICGVLKFTFWGLESLLSD